MKGVKKLGVRLGNWLTADEARRFWQAPPSDTLKGKRDRAILAVLLGCGLRRRELADLEFTHLQRREEHWAIVDLIGKGGHIRTIPVPDWVKTAVDLWATAAGISAGRRFAAYVVLACVGAMALLNGQRSDSGRPTDTRSRFTELYIARTPNGDFITANRDGSNADPNQPSELIGVLIRLHRRGYTGPQCARSRAGPITRQRLSA